MQSTDHILFKFCPEAASGGVPQEKVFLEISDSGTGVFLRILRNF